jgi:hypothetical protein
MRYSDSSRQKSMAADAEPLIVIKDAYCSNRSSAQNGKFVLTSGLPRFGRLETPSQASDHQAVA